MTDSDREVRIQECDNCGYETETTEYQYPKRAYWFCGVCAGTHLSKATGFPNLCPDPQLWKSIAVIGNMIISEIKTLKQEETNDKS